MFTFLQSTPGFAVKAKIIVWIFFSTDYFLWHIWINLILDPFNLLALCANKCFDFWEYLLAFH